MKAAEIERTGAVGERMCEIKTKQSKESDGQTDYMKQCEERERQLGHGERVKKKREMRGVSEVEDGGVQ